MLYLFYGTDAVTARAKMHAVLEGGKKKRPDAEVFRIEAGGFQEGMIDEWTGGMGLFEHKMIVVLDRVFENKEAMDVIAARAEALGASENLILILEGKLDKKTVEKLSKHAQKAELFEEKKEGRQFGLGAGNGPGGSGKVALKDWNAFAIADAFAARDKKKLWSLVAVSEFHDVPPEEISGMLFWQAKSMLLASGPNATAASTGLSPFVFDKSKRGAANYSSAELRKLASALISSYHEAHRGLLDLSVDLERFALSI